MNRIYKSICIGILSLMFLMLLISFFTGDASIRPEMTLSGILDGSWLSSYQSYFADTFPTGKMMEADFLKLSEFYNFGEENYIQMPET